MGNRREDQEIRRHGEKGEKGEGGGREGGGGREVKGRGAGFHLVKFFNSQKTGGLIVSG